ncbi:MAG: D-glycero-beta-D-manno-heptose-7-phosphate kinase [Promethearchaeota archaeon]
MNREKILNIIDNFKGKKIGVIGDLMLDQFIWGDVERISPEAPVPVVFVEKESFVPGGAGNTANNIASLGGKTFIVGLIGEDSAGQKLKKEFKKRGINTQGIFKNRKKSSIQKIRVIARGQQMIRIDKENNSYIDNQIEKKIINFIATHIKYWDAIVISDYAKGFVTKNLARAVIQLAKKYKKPVIGDTKPKHASYFKNVTILMPNHKEAVEIAGVEDFKKAGKRIQKKLKCNVLITQGADGMTLFEDKKIKHFSARAKEVFDVSGAGDTVVGAFALAQTAGADLETATAIANETAGIVVGKVGTATVSLEELKKDLIIDDEKK